MSISYAGYRTGFPYKFPFVDIDQNGNPIAQWDGSTYYMENPSGSSSKPVVVVGPGTQYPYGLTLTELAELVWRVKRLKIDYTYSTSQNISAAREGQTYDYNRSGNLVLIGGRNYATDLDFMIPVRPGWRLSILTYKLEFDSKSGISASNTDSANFSGPPRDEWDHYLDSSSEETNANVSVWLGLDSWAEHSDGDIVKSGGLYYPQIDVELWFSVDGYGWPIKNIRTFEQPWFDMPEAPTTTIPGVSVTFMGRPLPMYSHALTGYNLNQDENASEWETYSSSYTLELTAAIYAEYFSYGGKWNTATGAPL